MTQPPQPRTYLIIGCGVFGLSTALSLLQRRKDRDIHITLLDAAQTLPNPTGSSVDSSRIVRADYASAPYARLALEAQRLWRDRSDDGWGGQGRYHEPGFLLTADKGKEEYLRKSEGNVSSLVEGKGMIEKLASKEDIMRASRYNGASGDGGYVNWSSGWADAEACVEFAVKRVKKVGADRVSVRNGVVVERLLFGDGPGGINGKGRCEGVVLKGGEELRADQTILAAGAWSGALIDLRGRAVATGQVLAYLAISQEEQDAMGDRPTIMNMSRGMFVIPPRRRELKIARHGFGYTNIQDVLITWPRKSASTVNDELTNGSEETTIKVSVPEVGTAIPREAEEACREALREVVPEMADREFTRTRICWYSDTPEGNFIITHHPDYAGLFVATGGSGHGFKFFPVIGDKIVDVLEGQESEYAELWGWQEPRPNFKCCEDGSRSGPKNMSLQEELAK